MSEGLHIANRVFLPIDGVTETFAFLGRRGNGKTYAAMLLAELMLDAGAQIIALDPVGVWWGLRLMADGVTPGFPIPVFGGLHGDIPLEPTAGALMADLVCDRNLSAVLDVSQMVSAEQAKFGYHFARRFFQRKKALPSAVHVFIEESQEFVPQNLPPGGGEAAHMLHEFERLIKLGRNFGVGISLISQRPQEVNKKALNQTECLFGFQMTGTHERKAIREWTNAQGIENENVMDVLPTLERGNPLCWSPQWLGISKVVQIRKKKTLDVSATPKVGAKPVAPQQLGDLDLAKLRTDMSATIERAKEQDPKELRKELARLKRDLLAAQQATPPPPPPAERVEVSILKDEHVAQLHETVTVLTTASENVAAVGRDLTEALTKMRNSNTPRPSRRPAVAQVERPVAQVQTPVAQVAGGDVANLPKCERAILTVLAQHPDGCSINKLALLGGYRISGGFKNALASLRTLGFMEGANTQTMAITPAGHVTAEFDALPTGAALVDYWTRHPSLGLNERKVLTYLVSQYPTGISIDDLASQTGYKISGGFKNALARLRTTGLIVGRNTERMTVVDELGL